MEAFHTIYIVCFQSNYFDEDPGYSIQNFNNNTRDIYLQIKLNY